MPGVMPSKYQSEKVAVLSISQEMARKGLVVGSAGNVSMRLGPDLIAITPSRKHYSDLTAEDIQVIDFDGSPVEGELIPSVETMMHVLAYRARPDVGAVVHTHSLYASALAVAHLALPPIIDELVTAIGGEVRVTEYAFPSTEELAQHAAGALLDRNAVLLANHGVVGIGPTLRDALTVCVLVEHAAHIFFLARGLGEVHTLPAEIVALEQELYRMARAPNPAAGTPRPFPAGDSKEG